MNQESLTNGGFYPRCLTEQHKRERASQLNEAHSIKQVFSTDREHRRKCWKLKQKNEVSARKILFVPKSTRERIKILPMTINYVPGTTGRR